MLPDNIYNLNEITDAVWDEDITTHNTVDSAGATLQAKTEPTDIPTVSAIATAVWTSVALGTKTYQEAIIIMKRLLQNKVTKLGDTITIYEENGITVWKQYNLTDGGRVEI